MTRHTTTLSISRPFDARHVSGVGIPGVSHMSVTNNYQYQNSHMPTLEPDEIPTHTNISSAPKRSNSIADSLRRPSLRLKTSISRLRGRSASNARSPERYRAREREEVPTQDVQLQRIEYLPPKLPDIERSESRIDVLNTAQTTTPKMVNGAKKAALRTRPKRVDSGTAIDFDDVPVEERPLGFKEILAVKSFEERMRLYKKTREFWAQADHGLGDWVGRKVLIV